MKFTTRFFLLLVKNVLCSKLHCQKVSKLEHISYKIDWSLSPEGLTTLVAPEKVALSLSLALALSRSLYLSPSLPPSRYRPLPTVLTSPPSSPLSGRLST